MQLSQNKKKLKASLEKKINDMTEEELTYLAGISHKHLADELISSALITTLSDTNPSQEKLNHAAKTTKEMMATLLSENGVQSLLAAQMVTIHNLQMKCSTYAKHLPNSFSMTPYVNMTTKLSNTFLQQAQLLSKLHGKGQQKVTVEHVNVHNGGQAIVGNVTHNQGLKNDEEKN